MSSFTNEPGALTPEEQRLHKFYPGCLSLPRAASAPSPKDCPSGFMTFSQLTSSRPTSRDSSLTNMEEMDPFALYRIEASSLIPCPPIPQTQPESWRQVPRSSIPEFGDYYVYNIIALAKAVEIELHSTKQTLSQLSMIYEDTMATLTRSLTSARTSHEKRRARAIRLGMTVEEESSRVMELQAQMEMHTSGWERTLRDGENKMRELEEKLWKARMLGGV